MSKRVKKCRKDIKRTPKKGQYNRKIKIRRQKHVKMDVKKIVNLYQKILERSGKDVKAKIFEKKEISVCETKLRVLKEYDVERTSKMSKSSRKKSEDVKMPK